MPPDIESVWSGVTSMVIVRHPMSRIASAYNEKIIKQPSKYWADLGHKIVGKYRTNLGSGKPYPQEFIK